MDNYIRRLALALDAARAANRPLRISVMLTSGTAVGGILFEVTSDTVVLRSDRESGPAIIRADAIISYILKDA